jgi:hypothetical protein
MAYMGNPRLVTAFPTYLGAEAYPLMCSYLSTFAFDGLSKAVNYEKPISIFYRKE